MDSEDLKSVKVNFNLIPALEGSKDTALNCVVRWNLHLPFSLGLHP